MTTTNQILEFLHYNPSRSPHPNYSLLTLHSYLL